MSQENLKERKESVRRSAPMQFILTGFTQDLAFRVFAFERMGLDRIRTKCVVRADLALVRRYGIQVQELPLLCRNLLEKDDSPEAHTLTFTEDDMCLYAKDRTAARELAASKRKPPRKPPGENLGAAWRGHHPVPTAHTAPLATAASVGQIGRGPSVDE
jgi:hypothetical protein